MIGKIIGVVRFSRKISKAIKEGRDVVGAIEFLIKKYNGADDDAAWAWKEVVEFKDAVKDLV